jgi:large subunit ribosomal protein L32
MGVPKRKSSKQRIRRRHHSSAHQVRVAASKACPNCGAAHLPHRVCPSCGHYRGRQVVTKIAE